MENANYRPHSPSCQLTRRRGAILVFAAVVLVMIFAFAAFSIDVGYMTLVRSQLQNAADAAALAASAELGKGTSAVRQAARDVASRNTAGGLPVDLSDDDIELGIFSLASREFVANESSPNAVRVTTRVTERPLFFAPIIGHQTYSIHTSATSMLNPRDIVFVVDLSGSMNDDTDPWATALINSKFAPDGYPTVGTQLMQNVFDDFGFGTYPGVLSHVGAPLGVAQNNYAYAEMTKDNGPLKSSSIPSQYRISNSDSETTRKTKAYKWIIDKQIAVYMPNALPAPSSSTNYAYWEKYIDYVILSQQVKSGTPGVPRNGSNSKVTLPPNQDSDDMDGFNNPNRSSFPSASSSVTTAFRNKIGYLTYVQFMMDWGRDRSPDVSSSNNASAGVGTKTPLSVLSPHCPFHVEDTAAGNLSFPPREQPTHAVRRSLIAAIEVVRQQNLGVTGGGGDNVAIVTFDAIDSYHEPKVEVPLTSDFDAAIQACTRLQAVSDVGASTAMENGLIEARAHLKPIAEGGSARTYTRKVVVLLTDGVPNIYESSSYTINQYISQNPNSDFYGSSSANYNSVLMQADQIRADQQSLFAVGMGLGTDYNFMDRIARLANTDTNGSSPQGAGSPIDYEDRLTEIFQDIIQAPGSRLVR